MGAVGTGFSMSLDGPPQPVELEIMWGVAAPGVTHLRYRALK